MLGRLALGLVSVAATAFAQSAPYTDPDNGITFQAYTDNANGQSKHMQ